MAIILPAVPRLPTLALPITDKVVPILALVPTLAKPAVIIFPPVIFPVAFNVPATLTPVPVTTIIFALPAADVETLPLTVIFILLLPFCSKPLLIVVILPVVIIAVVVPKLPTLALPVTDKVVPALRALVAEILYADTFPVITMFPPRVILPEIPTFAKFELPTTDKLP